MTPTETRIYNEAKACLGLHITLNPAVSSEVGCAEAVSYVLLKAGIPAIPQAGIAGTAQLYQWLSQNPHFLRVEAPVQGAVIISPTSYGNGTIEGHVGILGAFGVQFPNEYGILSNNSDNGLFQEKWNLLTWYEYYGQKGGLPIAIFKAV